MRSHELSFYIVKSHRDPSTWRDIDKNGMHDEVGGGREGMAERADGYAPSPSHARRTFTARAHTTSSRVCGGACPHTQVDEVAEALFQHHRLLYGAYDHYAAKYSENETAPGEPDVWNVSFTAYM